MPKYIVRKGESFFYSSPPRIELCKTYGEGEIVDLPLVNGEPPIKDKHPVLRALTTAELKMTPSALKTREVGAEERPVEEPVAA